MDSFVGILSNRKPVTAAHIRPMTDKLSRYERLVQGRKTCRACQSTGLTNPATVDYDRHEIGPWTIWCGDLDANIMVVGQDWGDVKSFRDQEGLDSAKSPTNQMLRCLLRSVGFTIGQPPLEDKPELPSKKSGVYLTNAVLCLKNDGVQATVKPDWVKNCAPRFLKEQVLIVMPKVVVTLGEHAYRAMRLAFDLQTTEFRTAVNQRRPISFGENQYLVPVYHCGPRILNTHRKGAVQFEDWRTVLKALEAPDSADINDAIPTIDELWQSRDQDLWDQALARYWEWIKPKNVALEEELNTLDIDRIRHLDAEGWYRFLRDEYFQWKYTATNRLATTRKSLATWNTPGGLNQLDAIRQRLLSLDPRDPLLALTTAHEIPGLGTAGASGLLAVLYPRSFGTVDQFVVRALREVRKLPEAKQVEAMKETSLTLQDGVALIDIMRLKAKESNRLWLTDRWTPRMIDQILWTYGRPG